MGMSDVLNSIKEAEESADAKLTASKEKAAKIVPTLGKKLQI